MSGSLLLVVDMWNADEMGRGFNLTRVISLWPGDWVRSSVKQQDLSPRTAKCVAWPGFIDADYERRISHMIQTKWRVAVVQMANNFDDDYRSNESRPTGLRALLLMWLFMVIVNGLWFFPPTTLRVFTTADCEHPKNHAISRMLRPIHLTIMILPLSK